MILWGAGGKRDLVLQTVGVLAGAGYVEYLLLALLRTNGKENLDLGAVAP
jgi:hypothetical protein